MKWALIAIAALPATLRWATMTVKEGVRLALTLWITAVGAAAMAWLTYALWNAWKTWH